MMTLDLRANHWDIALINRTAEKAPCCVLSLRGSPDAISTTMSRIKVDDDLGLIPDGECEGASSIQDKHTHEACIIVVAWTQQIVR